MLKQEIHTTKDKLSVQEASYEQYSVRILCEGLQVDKGTFYNNILEIKKQNNSYQFRISILREQILEVYEESNQIYCAKKIRDVLESRGIETSDKMVAALMEEINLWNVRVGSKKL